MSSPEEDIQAFGGTSVDDDIAQYGGKHMGETPNFNSVLDRVPKNLNAYGEQDSNLWSATRRLGESLGDVYAPGVEFANQAAFGQLRPAVEKMTGGVLPEGHSPMGKVMQGAGGLAGLFAGPGGVINLAERAGSKLLPGLLGRVAGRTAGGASGYAYGADRTHEERTNQAKIGMALANAIPMITGGIGGLHKSFSLKGAQRGVNEAIETGVQSTDEAIGAAAQRENQIMGEGLAAIDDTGINYKSVNDAITKAAYALDETGSTFGNPNSEAGKILSLKLSPYAKAFSGKQLQAHWRTIQSQMRKMGGKVQREVGNFFREMLPENFQAVKSARHAGYQKEAAVEPLTKVGKLKQIIHDVMPYGKLNELRGAQSGMTGLNVIDPLIKAGKHLRGVGRNRAIGGFLTQKAAPVAGGLGGIGYLLSKMGG